MARIFNLIIVICELIAFFKVRKAASLKKGFMYYTILSNAIAFVSSLFLVLLGQKYFVEVLRFLSTGMLLLTFVVTAFVLVPLTGNIKELLLSGAGLFHHLIVPILSLISFLFAEDRVPTVWVILPLAMTLVYGIIMLYLNHKGKADGPYPFFMINKIGKKRTALWMVILMIVVGVLSAVITYKKPVRTDMKYVFVHGLSGWGSYDTINDFFPYWGLSGGSVIRYLNNQGYESYAASVAPTGSAWDRACELYAQLAGTRVDYGLSHSRAAGHERFGEDFTGRALYKNFETSRFSLIGHSFGGATVRLFSEILRNGSEEEMAMTDESDLSPFFKGGNGDNLVSLVTLAAPTNGTTAYDLYEDESFDINAIEIPEEYEKSSGVVSQGTRAVPDGRASWDYASFDMHIDNALAMNERITTFEDVYYFSYPCASMMEGEASPDPSITEDIFMKSAIYMSRYTGATKGGFLIDESWQPNDGLVNEISAKAPFNAPQSQYNGDAELLPGIWYVMPTVRGDHMSLQGGLTKKVNVKPFYMELAGLLEKVSKL